MKGRGQTWRELARKLPYAGLPFGLCGTRFSVQEIMDWREQEQIAGRPSGLEGLLSFSWPLLALPVSRLQSGRSGYGWEFAAIRGMRGLRALVQASTQAMTTMSRRRRKTEYDPSELP